MKQVAFRLAGAILATAICFGASARAHVPALYAPVGANTNTKVTAPVTITRAAYLGSTSVVGTVSVADVVNVNVVNTISTHTTETRGTKGRMTQSLEQTDPVAQFDVTK